ncbi:MAG: radical SAM protein [Clostridiaceae bacterium]|nr:radical SAM protein [Clostridiaceae bacterium]
MTREEINSLLYDYPEVYRPPFEAESALLEVTHGCSYGKCFFCDFARDEYFPFELEDIERKIKLLSHVIDGNDRLYFLGSNPFCLPSKRILTIIDLVHKYLPCVNEISMYARADDINRKPWSDMMELKHAGLTDLHVGLESGSDRILKLHNKGETVFDIQKALDTLASCEIGYNLTAILGMGGRDLSYEHAVKTAMLFNMLTPISIWCMALKIWPNTPLYYLAENGGFIQMTPLEILREERHMLGLMDMKKGCIYVDSTVLNKYTLSARLPHSKDSALENLDRLIAEQEREDM